MHSLRARLLLSHLLPLLLVVVLVGIALTYLLETQVLLATASRELERQAVLVSAIARNELEIWYDPLLAQNFVTRVGPLVSGRLMLLDANGVLLASNDPADQSAIGQSLALPGLYEVFTTGTAIRVDYGQTAGTGAADVLAPVMTWDGRIIGIIRLTDPLANVYARFPRTRTLIFGVLGGGLLIGALVGWLLALDLERPLRRTTQAIDRLTKGEPSAPLPEHGPQELRGLVRAFNALSEQLQTSEKARQRLLANLVHELGRPLGALLSAVQALAGGAADEPALRQELLTGMEAELRRMQRLLEELTQLYGQTVGPLELQRRPTTLGPWLAETLGPWREAAQAQGLTWETDLPTELPTVTIDADRLAQALGNLLSNAVKYTPAGGTVMISAGTTAAEFWLRVQDTGPGIPSEEQERIFAPFYRGSAGRRFPQGMGLGLSLARDLIVAHGGRLELQSQPGQGATFTLWLPLQPPEPIR